MLLLSISTSGASLSDFPKKKALGISPKDLTRITWSTGRRPRQCPVTSCWSTFLPRQVFWLSRSPVRLPILFGQWRIGPKILPLQPVEKLVQLPDGAGITAAGPPRIHTGFPIIALWRPGLHERFYRKTNRLSADFLGPFLGKGTPCVRSSGDGSSNRLPKLSSFFSDRWN